MMARQHYQLRGHHLLSKHNYYNLISRSLRTQITIDAIKDKII